MVIYTSTEMHGTKEDSNLRHAEFLHIGNCVSLEAMDGAGLFGVSRCLGLRVSKWISFVVLLLSLNAALLR